MYEPKLARFTARDPFHGGRVTLLPARGKVIDPTNASANGSNRDNSAFETPYVYADNNPVTLIDPSGLAPVRKCPKNKKADDQGGARKNQCPKKWKAPTRAEQYGCYCGREPKPARKTVPAPIDEVDRCCCVHDNDYGKVEKKKMTKEVADARLCCCIQKAVDERKCFQRACNIGYNKVYTFFRCQVLMKKYNCKKLLSCLEAQDAQEPVV